jgi:hypothetical protein
MGHCVKVMATDEGGHLCENYSPEMARQEEAFPGGHERRMSRTGRETPSSPLPHPGHSGGGRAAHGRRPRQPNK